MNELLVFVCPDDILTFSRSQPEHVEHVKCVLQRLLENLLFVKAFHISKVSFQGFTAAPGSIKMDPAEVKAVLDWPERRCSRSWDLPNFTGGSSGTTVWWQGPSLPSSHPGRVPYQPLCFAGHSRVQQQKEMLATNLPTTK